MDGNELMNSRPYTQSDWVHYYTLLLVKAWTDEGVSPWYHRRAKKRLKREWPLLYEAVEGLVISKNLENERFTDGKD